jgi:hypothetical protein
MNVDEDILNYKVSSFFLSFLSSLFFLITGKQKKTQREMPPNTSGSKNLKEALLIIINSQAYQHESPAKYQPGTNLVGQTSQLTSCSITRCMQGGVKTPINRT